MTEGDQSPIDLSDLSWPTEDDDPLPVRKWTAESDDASKRSTFDAALQGLFLAGAPDSAGLELLRAIVERDAWFVATLPDGGFDAVEVKPGTYGLAIGNQPDPSANAKRKANRNGHGGRLLPIFSEKPGRASTRLDGRALVRALTEDIDGLLIDSPPTRATELGRDLFPDLRELADACDLEDMLARPGPDQADRLKRAKWLVILDHGRLRTEESTGGGQLTVACTHRDRGGYDPRELVEMEGERLFRMCAEDDEVDGILVNRGFYLGHGETRIANVLLAPGIVRRLLDGEDARPGACPLPARSRDEVELWLDLRGFPRRGRDLVEVPYPEETLIRATSTDGQVGRWRDQETLTEQESSDGEWSPVFRVRSVDSHETVMDPGSTRILCAGLLAKELSAGAYDSGNAARYWRVGRSLLIGRFVDDFDRARSRRRVNLATELARLLPPNADRIPRSAILTVEGAVLLREHPHAASRSWIEATIRQAERYTKRWVWWR